MVQFRDDTAWAAPPKRDRGPGAPPVEVPEILSEWLEYTYRKGKVCEIPAEEGDEGTQELLRAARIYCTRQGRKFHHQWITDDEGKTVLQFRMRDARTYKRRSIRGR